MLTSTALVLMMSVPALALFYGGMVRAKNMLSMLMQVFVVFSLIVVLWCIYGYSLAFTEGNAFFGGFDRLFLHGTFDSAKGEYAMAATFSKNTPLYELVYVAYQATFAAITVCLIVGGFAERMKFSAVLLFSALWFTFAYCPIAHMVWFWPGPDAFTDAKAAEKATVVHVNAGIAGIVGAIVLGKRIGFGKESMAPHNLPMTMIGASLLWVGWFGFNAGSALEANGSAGLAFMNTFLATACAVLAWTFGEWMLKGKPSMLGAASGAVAGLVAITPAAGNVGIPGAFVIGAAAGLICLWGVNGLKRMIGVDDSLDVFGVHAVWSIRAISRSCGSRRRRSASRSSGRASSRSSRTRSSTSCSASACPRKRSAKASTSARTANRLTGCEPRRNVTSGRSRDSSRAGGRRKEGESSPLHAVEVSPQWLSGRPHTAPLFFAHRQSGVAAPSTARA